MRTGLLSDESIPGWHNLEQSLDPAASYQYSGVCPISGQLLSLPRTRTAEELVTRLARELPLTEGKMFGVLVARDARGRLGYGRAFSGQLDGTHLLEGWAPPLHLPTPTVSEATTLQALARWKVKLQDLHRAIESHPHHALATLWNERDSALREELRLAKSQRALARSQNLTDLAELERQGRADSLRWREFLREKKTALGEGDSELAHLRDAIVKGRASRKALSRNLQAEMHQQMAKSVTSFLGCAPEQLFPEGIPTGTGDCCAPKLLAWAARHELTPLAMAELWWGPTSVGDKIAGEFYPACPERCQALLGPLLSLALRPPIGIDHVDAEIVVAVKPSGLLTVPGRYHWNQDSLLTRLSQRWPGLLPVHRLDLETSGLVVLARTPAAQAELRRQFEAREVDKRYLAVLDAPPPKASGRIELPLADDPEQPGRTCVELRGKPALTEYAQRDDTLIELRPITGRSHQLRVHVAQGLGLPIRGDRLYGSAYFETLKLHCSQLGFHHPSTGELLTFECPPNFSTLTSKGPDEESGQS